MYNPIGKRSCEYTYTHRQFSCPWQFVTNGWWIIQKSGVTKMLRQATECNRKCHQVALAFPSPGVSIAICKTDPTVCGKDVLSLGGQLMRSGWPGHSFMITSSFTTSTPFPLYAVSTLLFPKWLWHQTLKIPGLDDLKESCLFGQPIKQRLNVALKMERSWIV